MQQLCYILNIDQCLTSIYHPQSNPVERKNRDLKTRLAILVGNNHQSWKEKLPFIRFSLNTAECESTGQSAAFLQFARELRTLDDVKHDIKAVIENDNFVPEITPYLKRFARTVHQVQERVEKHQDKQKKYDDMRRRENPIFNLGDKVWVSLHPVSKGHLKKTGKFMPKRDGPYVIVAIKSPTTFDIADPNEPDKMLDKYHVSVLTPFQEQNKFRVAHQITPVTPLRKRGRPKRKRDVQVATGIPTKSPPSALNRHKNVLDSLPRRLRSQRGRL
nr:uncharacterized protein LOC107443754 [Parasteatoda tepidariorum]